MGAEPDTIATWLASAGIADDDAAKAITTALQAAAYPIPIEYRRGREDWIHLMVQGHEAVAITSLLPRSTIVAWHDDHMMYAVGGTYPLTEVETIARSLSSP